MRHVISNPGKQLSMRERGSVERQAINTPIQGGAADVVMLAMIRLHHDKRLAEMGWRLLLQVVRGAPARRGNLRFPRSLLLRSLLRPRLRGAGIFVLPPRSSLLLRC